MGYWYLAWFLQSLIQLSALSVDVCKMNEVKFLGKCWCEPGWESYPSWDGPLNCSKPILKIDNCDCEPGDLSRSFLHNESWLAPYPGDYDRINRCTNLCKWNKQVAWVRVLEPILLTFFLLHRRLELQSPSNLSGWIIKCGNSYLFTRKNYHRSLSIILKLDYTSLPSHTNSGVTWITHT